MHRRARPHGLAAGVGIQLACSGGGRYRALEMRYWRRAVLADGGATSDRGSHRHQCSEPHVGLRAPGVRPHRITRNTGRAQCVYTADPCNTVATAQTRVELFLSIRSCCAGKEISQLLVGKRRGTQPRSAQHPASEAGESSLPHAPRPLLVPETVLPPSPLSFRASRPSLGILLI